MNKNLIIILVVILVSGLSLFAQKNDLQILETGGFHGEEVRAETGEIWSGLFKQGETFILLPVVITVESFHDEIIDNHPDEKTGKEVKVLGRSKPIFLLKGEGFGQAQTVETVFADARPIDRTFDKTYQFKGQTYRLKVVSKGDQKAAVDREENYLNENSILVLTSGNTSQVLYEPGGCSDCFWQINWAGDLDMDGKLDFYLYLTNHYNVGNLKLFLSSGAENGKLVKEVAEFTTTGC